MSAASRARAARSCTARRTPARDQSWFLFGTTRDQLEFLRFPLGDVPDKRRVRGEADRLGLAVAAKPDSQDLCFVPEGSYAELVARLRPSAAEPGEIVGADGVGAAAGMAGPGAATRSARARRLGEAAQMRAGERQRVVALDPATGRVVVGPRDQGGREAVARLARRELADRAGRRAGLRCQVQLRAREAVRAAGRGRGRPGAAGGAGAACTWAGLRDL